MGKVPEPPAWNRPEPQLRHSWSKTSIIAATLVTLTALYHLPRVSYTTLHDQYYDVLTGGPRWRSSLSPYGPFPDPDDSFHFLPCTNATLPPALDDPNPETSWKLLFDPDPAHWNWGNATNPEEARDDDPYAGRGIYLCGYLDVPLDYTNKSEPRIVRLAVTKFQVSGLARAGGCSRSRGKSSAGAKSERTIVIEPGGPGGSGTEYAWRVAQEVTQRFSGGKFDVLGWDPRGVNTSLPALACFPYDVDRDRWSLLRGQYREVSGSPESHLQLADAMNEAVFHACWQRHGDLARFIGTAFVARDMEEIRKALGEDELTGYLVSYGTGIGQTYANMFPHSVGRMILDGTEYVRDHRLLGGFGWTALDNATDAWHDGFLGECLNAGPKHCALAQPRHDEPVTLATLEARMGDLMSSLIERPMTGYSGSSGPSLITYSSVVAVIYRSLYKPQTWPTTARMLYDLEEGNSTLATVLLDEAEWEYDPTVVSPLLPKVASDELGDLVICADAYDAELPPEGLEWWGSLWANMTAKSWISGNSRFYDVFPCRHFTKYWPEPAEVYRGDLNHTLKNPVLLIAEPYDPATPLRNGRRLLLEMGPNARLIVHHGYGHASRDPSACTNDLGKRFILHGELPDDPETACFADEKPYLYGVNDAAYQPPDLVEAWREHMGELRQRNPRLVRGGRN
ncbi:alpha/beta-hydrolase [Xylariomycetidae sp. FL2044]|nr:alpha/beta-hydrolase [Xylariomycetidae sp. FL2044]